MYESELASTINLNVVNQKLKFLRMQFVMEVRCDRNVLDGLVVGVIVLRLTIHARRYSVCEAALKLALKIITKIDHD